MGIFLLSSNWVACGLAFPLEAPYSRNPTPAASADAIVVLSGSVDPPTLERPYPVVSIDTYGRLLHGIWLFKHWKALPILVCGGTTERSPVPTSESMRQFPRG
jgi:uncharacterized SAM-binding protein YcdF (DUF218 family)